MVRMQSGHALFPKRCTPCCRVVCNKHRRRIDLLFTADGGLRKGLSMRHDHCRSTATPV